MKCLETRTTAEGYRRRRYVLASGVRVTTIEVPATVWHAINRQGRDRDRAAQHQRAVLREAMRVRARKLRAQGVSARDIATELRTPKRTVLRWLKAAA